MLYIVWASSSVFFFCSTHTLFSHILTPHTLHLLSTIELAHNPLNKQNLLLIEQKENMRERGGSHCTKTPQGQERTGIPEPGGGTGIPEPGGGRESLGQGKGRERPREGVRCNPLTWQTKQENKPNMKINPKHNSNLNHIPNPNSEQKKTRTRTT